MRGPLLALAVALAAAYAPTAHAAAPTPAAACAALKGGEVAAREITLPTKGARITDASLANDANGQFCKVLGAIAPVDSTAPAINFEVNLPTTWNGKALQFGGGGFDGTLVNGLTVERFGAPTDPTPLKKGYVTFGSDSGHQVKGPGADASFAMNDEALRNFGGDQIRKTYDVAQALIKRRYGSAARRTYFDGNSQGGHEGLIALQRWPQAYDGVIAIHPVYDLTLLHLDANHLAKALYATPANWLSPAKATLLYQTAIKLCDELDGAKDGLISNRTACQKAFTPATLRCADGKAGANCLTDAEIATVRTINSEWDLGFPTEAGVRTFARWPILEGGDTRTLFSFGTRPNPGRPPEFGKDAFQAIMGDQTARYVITRDASFDSLNFDPAKFRARIQAVSKLQDANAADITAYEKRGGKLILMHGTVDMSVTPYNTIAYYERLQKQYGRPRLDKFVRFYVVPGFSHGGGPFAMSWNALDALDAWVEKGQAPKGLITTDTNKETAGRSRPLCEYPAWPKYSRGDINAAWSFACVTQ